MSKKMDKIDRTGQHGTGVEITLEMLEAAGVTLAIRRLGDYLLEKAK